MDSRIVAALSLALIISAPLLAAGGGGGGGGGSAPSASVPQYDPAVEYRKGIEALKIKDYKTAKRAFDRVIAVAPKDANSHYLAGLSRTGTSDWKGAKKFLEKAVKLDPALTSAQRELGITYAKLGEKPKAAQILTLLKAKSKECGGNCPQSADLTSSVDAVSAAIASTPQASLQGDNQLLFASAAGGDTQYLAAVGLINERRYSEAIVALDEARKSFGPHPDILTYLGFANRKLKRFETAETYYRQALSVAPNHRGATEYYGELMVERGDLAGARKMLSKLQKQCRFGCAEAEELQRWIVAGRSPHSA
jgi:tetratricopeptide (TPR) repeat protein